MKDGCETAGASPAGIPALRRFLYSLRCLHFSPAGLNCPSVTKVNIKQLSVIKQRGVYWFDNQSSLLRISSRIKAHVLTLAFNALHNPFENAGILLFLIITLALLLYFLHCWLAQIWIILHVTWCHLGFWMIYCLLNLVPSLLNSFGVIWMNSFVILVVLHCPVFLLHIIFEAFQYKIHHLQWTDSLEKCYAFQRPPFNINTGCLLNITLAYLCYLIGFFIAKSYDWYIVMCQIHLNSIFQNLKQKQ